MIKIWLVNENNRSKTLIFLFLHRLSILVSCPLPKANLQAILKEKSAAFLLISMSVKEIEEEQNWVSFSFTFLLGNFFVILFSFAELKTLQKVRMREISVRGSPHLQLNKIMKSRQWILDCFSRLKYYKS